MILHTERFDYYTSANTFAGAVGALGLEAESASMLSDYVVVVKCTEKQAAVIKGMAKIMRGESL